ncbi:sarcosine oxidase subunit gamma [Pikeienuella sp. HZG-20]|uniref:sarcosine oxidase subunit gamma n=1 Tax=Paludibacillus litoralis TaxID=3133267 RepID=UPI0030EF9A27
MSEPVSAAAGAAFEAPEVSIRDRGPVGMVTIRGDFADPEFAAAVKAVCGCAPPEIRRFSEAGGGGLGWMAPDELLFVTDYAAAPAAEAALRAGLAGRHHLAVNVSDARAAFRIAGPGARELLARGAPVDLAPEAFVHGDLRRTRFGQVAAAFWLGTDDAFTLICFRSLGAHVFDWLKTSARAGAGPHIF